MNAYTAQLQDMTRTDLYNLAKDANLPGRSKMTKAQLIDALTALQAEVLDTQAPEVQDYYTEDESTPAQSDHSPNTDGLPTAWDIITDTKPQRVYTAPLKMNAQVVRDNPGTGYVQMGKHMAIFVREGSRWALVTQTGETFEIRSRSIGKMVKRWAKRLNIWADNIEVARTF